LGGRIGGERDGSERIKKGGKYEDHYRKAAVSPADVGWQFVDVEK